MLSSIPLTYAAGTSAPASAENTSEQVNYDSQEYQKNLESSLEQYQVIKEARKEAGVKNYDVYLDDDGILNVMVSDDTSNSEYGSVLSESCTSSVREYAQALSEADSADDEGADVIYRKVQFSKSYLNSIQKALRGYTDEFSLVSVGSGNMDNKVEIELMDSSKESDILEFLGEKIDDFNSEAVVFTVSGKPVEDAKRSYPGRKVYWSDGSYTYSGTSGFNAKDKSTGKYGIVTAAHVATQGKTIYNALDAAIGKPTHWQHEKSMDAAFVPFSYDGFEPSMAINGDTSNKIQNYVKVADIVKGMKVGMYGITTKGTTGKVEEVSADFMSMTKMVKCSYSSQNGDSGGPLYLTSASNGYAKNSIVSIHRGSSDSYRYSTKVGYILVTFGLSLYTG